MARIIKMKNELAEKRQEIENKLKKEKTFINIIVIGILLITFLIAGVTIVFAADTNTDTNTTKTFEEKYQESKAKIEEGKAKSEKQAAENKAKFEVNKVKLEKQGGIFKNCFIAIFFIVIVMVVRNMYIIIRGKKLKELEQQLGIYNSGLEGEEKAVQVLSVLSDDYTIINNVKLTVNGCTSEIDNLIIGPNGIFVVEVKNHSGIISGDISNHDWKHEKNNGMGYSIKELYNPVMQVVTHGKRVEEFLESTGVKEISVKTIVCFINSNITLNISGTSNTTLYTYAEAEQMLRNIGDYNNEKDVVFKEEDRDKIINLICNHIPTYN